MCGVSIRRGMCGRELELWGGSLVEESGLCL